MRVLLDLEEKQFLMRKAQEYAVSGADVQHNYVAMLEANFEQDIHDLLKDLDSERNN